MTGTRPRRAQSGIDRLLLFVVAVLALLFVAPHALGFAGIDIQERAGGPPEPTSESDLTILAARGDAVAIDGSSIGVVRLVVSPNPGRTPVDLTGGMAMFVGGESYHLAPAGSGGEGFDGTYVVERAGGGSPVLDEATQRGVLRFDLGSDDVDDAEEVGERLEAGETATVTLVTARGEAISRELRVPERLDGTDDVPL